MRPCAPHARRRLVLQRRGAGASGSQRQVTSHNMCCVVVCGVCVCVHVRMEFGASWTLVWVMKMVVVVVVVVRLAAGTCMRALATLLVLRPSMTSTIPPRLQGQHAHPQPHPTPPPRLPSQLTHCPRRRWVCAWRLGGGSSSS